MKVLWLCLQGLGDTLMATPAIRALRQARPDWRIAAVATQRNSFELLAGLEEIDSAHYAPYWELGALRSIRALHFLRRERFDISFLPYPAVRPEYHAFSALAGARKRIAHAYEPLYWTLGFLEHRRVPIRAGHHVVNNMALLCEIGVETGPPGAYAAPPMWFSAAQTGRIGLHVGSMTYKGNELKRWPARRYIELGNLLRAEGHELAFIAGPNERAETVAIRDAIDAHAPLIEGALAEVAREISAMSAVIAADNGIAHLAAAMRVPTVVLFGITDPALCAPWGKDVHVVHPSACPPCFRFGDKRFACKRHINVRCLREDLKVDHVLAALRATVPSHAPSRGPVPNGAQL